VLAGWGGTEFIRLAVQLVALELCFIAIVIALGGLPLPAPVLPLGQIGVPTLIIRTATNQLRSHPLVT
jgi:hypothetical protein